MVLSKNEILDEISKNKLVEDFVDLKEQLQPASFDLTLAKVYEFDSKGALDFDNSERKICDVREISFNQEGWVDLKPGSYKARFNETIRLPSSLAGITVSRSSLARNGCMVHTGFWDPGYSGKGECVIVIGDRGLKLKKNAKIAQMIFFKLSTEATDLYSGMHQNAHL
ncbi:deoxyuridine 5'-triphosphate nucleotidohydrolase [Candidatus Micrarchaeota archaeon]|nr:deoxyuridine 5'-triphosphate nucleotidohydrolase [Candidatus Micrarchaeota archaeon]